MKNEDFALRFAEERKRLGFSQAEFGRVLQANRESVRKWETGLAQPGAKALAEAVQMGVDIQYLFTGIRSLNLAHEKPVDLNVKMESVSGVGVAMSGANVSVVNTNRHVTRMVAEVKPGLDHITDSEAATLQRLVAEVIGLEEKVRKKPASPRSVWSRLNAHCGVPTYRLIAKADFPKARSYLDQWLGRLSNTASAPVKDGENWRIRKISYIKINSKEPPDAQALAAYIARNFGAASIADLSNDELEKAYRYVAGRRNKNRPV